MRLQIHVTLNVPKHVPWMGIHFNIFLISNFLAITTLQQCPGPDRSDQSVRPVSPEIGFLSVQGRIIRHEARSSDIFQRQTGIWTGSSDLGSDHTTLYRFSFNVVLLQMFCLDESHDVIFISCISKTHSLLERH